MVEPESGDSIIDGLAFVAEATVLIGASLLMGFGMAELFKKKESKELER